MVSQHRRERGTDRLRSLLNGEAEPALTRSQAEARLLGLIRQAGLPFPKTNTRVAGFEVDFLWASEGLVLEVDGFAYHSSARMFERDRRRDAVLMAARLRVMRVTWRQIVHEPVAVIVRLTRALDGTASRTQT